MIETVKYNFLSELLMLLVEKKSKQASLISHIQNPVYTTAVIRGEERCQLIVVSTWIPESVEGREGRAVAVVSPPLQSAKSRPARLFTGGCCSFLLCFCFRHRFWINVFFIVCFLSCASSRLCRVRVCVSVLRGCVNEIIRCVFDLMVRLRLGLVTADMFWIVNCLF